MVSEAGPGLSDSCPRTAVVLHLTTLRYTNETTMDTERRTSPRTSIDILFNAFQAGWSSLCLALDVSEDGIGLQRIQDGRETSGDQIDVEFQLPGDDEVIVATGTIRSLADRYLGLKFDRISDEDRRRIQLFVAAA